MTKPLRGPGNLPPRSARCDVAPKTFSPEEIEEALLDAYGPSFVIPIPAPDIEPEPTEGDAPETEEK